MLTAASGKRDALESGDVDEVQRIDSQVRERNEDVEEMLNSECDCGKDHSEEEKQ